MTEVVPMTANEFWPYVVLFLIVMVCGLVGMGIVTWRASRRDRRDARKP